MPKIPKFYTPCQYCGITTERSTSRTDVTCFDCKKLAVKARKHKRSVKKLKVEQTLAEWIQQHQHNSK